MLLSLAVVIASLLGAGMVVPQAVRIYRTRSVDGLSGAGVGLGIAMNLWWVFYSVSIGLWSLLPVSSVTAIFYSVIAYFYVGIVSDERVRWLFVGGFGFGVVPFGFLLVGGWAAVGLLLGVSYAAMFAPAVYSAVTSGRLGGISPTTWVMACVEAVLWYVYGASVGDPALQIGGGGGAIMAAIILGRLAYIRSFRRSFPIAVAENHMSPNAAAGSQKYLLSGEVHS